MDRQDYIAFGSSAPIVVTPYEIVAEGGDPLIRVHDPHLYIQMRDLLLVRQLGRQRGLITEGHPEWGVVDQGDCQESEELGREEVPSEQVRHTHMEEYVDRMLGTLSKQNLREAAMIVVEVLDDASRRCDEPAYKQIADIYRKVLDRTNAKVTRQAEDN